MTSAVFTTEDLPANVAILMHVPNPSGSGTIKIHAIKRGKSERAADSKFTRVYGALDTLVPELMALEPFRGISIPTDAEDAADRVRAATWKAWKRSTLAEGTARLRTVLDGLGDDVHLFMSEVENVRFSQTAGCSCPCSPGFILSVRAFAANGNGLPVDLYLE